MPDSEPTAPFQARPWGRTLSDLWLGGEDGKLHPAEWKLLACAAKGEWCAQGSNIPSQSNHDNRIRSEFIRFVSLGGDTANPLHENGLKLSGAFIECATGLLDFEGCTLSRNLNLLNCHIDGAVNLLDAIAETIVLDGCTLSSLNGDRLSTSGDIFLRNGFATKQTVRFYGAKIGGSLNCEAGKFNDPKLALFCDGAIISGSIFLRDGFEAQGRVSLIGAKVGGSLTCSAGRFHGQEVSLHCDRVQTSGSVFFRNGFEASGTVRLHSANIGNNLSCSNGRLLCAAKALYAENAKIGGDVQLQNGFLSLGTVDLSNATIQGNLFCNDGTFSSKDNAIHAPRATINGNVNLGKECRVAGQISFQSTTIGGDVTFAGGSFEGKPAINLRNAKVDGMLVWRDVEHAHGELNLAGAQCKSLNMDWDSWARPSQIRLDTFTYDRFAELPEGCNSQFWRNWLERQPERHLTTRYRPNPYQQLAMVLDGMGHEEEARDIRIEHREKQRLFSTYYEPMPGDGWAQSMRHLGNFWKWVQKKVIGHGYRPGIAVIWLLGLIIAGTGIYEYAARTGIMAPTHPLIFKEAIWQGDLAETPVGKIPEACRKNWVHPKDTISGVCASAVASEYSTFNSFVYSLDTAIPVVNFRMEDDWAPRVVDWKTGQPDMSGWLVRSWEWMQIGLGWAFSLLFVSAIGGVIRRD